MRSRTTAGVVIIGESAVVAFDATMREMHAVSLEVTRYEVESGTNVGAHARLRPREIELIAVTTDTPMRELHDTTENRDRYVLRTLEQIAARKELVSIKCHMGRFDGYLIEDIDLPINPDDGASLSPRVSLVEYRQISTTSIATPDAYLDALVRSTAAQGDDPTPQDSEATEGEERTRSLATALDDATDGAITDVVGGLTETVTEGVRAMLGGFQ